MTLGNMRDLGVTRLIASCLNRCMPAHRIGRSVELPGGNVNSILQASSGLRQVRCQRQSDRRAPELERAAGDADKAAVPLMPRWRADYIGKVLSTLGTVEAPDEKSAIAKAAEEFNITPARQNKIVVTKLGDKK
jgi:hypothetical protein